jgi:protocatechuate 3,4-dioxygenase beta subunit
MEAIMRNFCKLFLIFAFGIFSFGNLQAADKKLTCSGSVVDINDNPLSDVKLSLYLIRYGSAADGEYSELLESKTSSTMGEFTFEVDPDLVNRASRLIFAEREGFSMGCHYWSGRRDSNPTIVLTDPSNFKGKVVDVDKKPVVDAQVRVLVMLNSLWGQRDYFINPQPLDLLVTTTNEQGGFEFENIPQNVTAEFLVKKTGFGTVCTAKSSSMQSLSYSAGQSDIEITLPPEAIIKGTAVEQVSGKAVSGVKLLSRNSRPLSHLLPGFSQTKEDGTFIFGGLVEGEHSISIDKPRDALSEWVSAPMKVRIECGGDIAECKLELVKGGVLEVLIKDSETNETIEKVSINARNQETQEYKSTLTNSEGIGRLRLLPGQYTFYSAYKEGYSRKRIEESFEIEEGKSLQIEESLTKVPTITGRVSGADGKPVAGAIIKTLPSGRNTAKSDEDGKYEVEWEIDRHWTDREDAKFLLTARHIESNRAAAAEITETTRNMDITLSDAIIIKGAVTDPNNNPIKNVIISAMLRYSMWGSTITQDPRPVTDKQGIFEVNALPTGYVYSLYVRADGYGTVRPRLELQDVEEGILDAGKIILPVADMQITGTVMDIDGKPVADARLSIYSEGQPDNCQAVSDKDGKFVFEKVCKGPVRIHAYCTVDSVRKQANVETEGGATDIKVVVMEGTSQTAYAPKILPSLKGKKIPDMSDFSVKPGLADSGRLLMCFFDMNQRPSRHCVKELAAKSEMLTEKGVTVVLIQAVGLEEQALKQWSTENNITQITAMVGEDEEKTLENWGVNGLPWLILTDKEHVVTAEGFSLNELNDMLEKVTTL